MFGSFIKLLWLPLTVFILHLQGSLEETYQSDLFLDSGPGRKNPLLTDRDPILGGIQGLCDTAGKTERHTHHTVWS